MRKNKLTLSERKVAAKRARKRDERLKDTQKQKNVKKTAAMLEKKKLQKRENEEIKKIIDSRYGKLEGLLNRNPTTFSKEVYRTFAKKNLKILKESTD